MKNTLSTHAWNPFCGIKSDFQHYSTRCDRMPQVINHSRFFVSVILDHESLKTSVLTGGVIESCVTNCTDYKIIVSISLRWRNVVIQGGALHRSQKKCVLELKMWYSCKIDIPSKIRYVELFFLIHWGLLPYKSTIVLCNILLPVSHWNITWTDADVSSITKKYFQSGMILQYIQWIYILCSWKSCDLSNPVTYPIELLNSIYVFMNKLVWWTKYNMEY